MIKGSIPVYPNRKMSASAKNSFCDWRDSDCLICLIATAMPLCVPRYTTPNWPCPVRGDEMGDGYESR